MLASMAEHPSSVESSVRPHSLPRSALRDVRGERARTFPQFGGRSQTPHEQHALCVRRQTIGLRLDRHGRATERAVDDE